MIQCHAYSKPHSEAQRLELHSIASQLVFAGAVDTIAKIPTPDYQAWPFTA